MADAQVQENSEQSSESKAKPGSRHVYHRRRTIISFPVQGRIIFFSLLIHVLTVTFLYIITERAFETMISATASISKSERDLFLEYCQNIRSFIDLAFLVGGSVSLFGLLLCQAVLSNRLIGPAYRITQALKKANAGEAFQPHSLNLRKGDFFTELAEELRKLLGRS